MLVHPITESLESLAFFQDIPEQHLEFIAGCASHVRFKEGEFLLLEGHTEQVQRGLRSYVVHMQQHFYTFTKRGWEIYRQQEDQSRP